MRTRVRLRASTGKSVRLLALASALTVVTMLPGAEAAGANVTRGHLAGYRQIANLTGPNIPFFKAAPGSLVADIVFVDPALHRVYLSDQSNEEPGTHGRVVGAIDAWDTRTFKFVGAMYGGFTGLAGFPQSFDTEGPDGVLVDDLGHIWAGNGNDHLVVGDARTMKEIKVITTGGSGRADELAYDPLNQTILVTNPGASPPGWTLIDARTFRILGRATLGHGVPTGSIEQPKFDPVLGKFVSSVGQLSSHDTHGAVAVVDTQVVRHTHTVPAKAYRLSAKCNPLGLAIGPGSDLFLSCLNDGPVIATALPDAAGFVVDNQFTQACCSDEAWYDPHLGRYYASSFLNPNGTGKDPVVTVVDARTRSFITNIPIFTPNLAPNGSVAPEPDMSFHSLAADPVTGYVYVPAATGIRVFAATTGTAVPSAHTGEPWSGWPYWMLVAATAALGYGMFEAGRRRRRTWRGLAARQAGPPDASQSETTRPIGSRAVR